MAFKFILITQEDPFYVRIFFEEFLARYPKREEIAGVVIAPAMGKKSLARLIGQMFDFYGPRDFVLMGMRYVLYRLARKIAPLLAPQRFFSIDQVCAHFQVPVSHVADLNGPDFLAQLAGMKPDLIVSVAAPQVFKAGLIGLPRLGCINVHNSKLPKYRGMLPNFWQMYHGEKSVGTTIHRINVALDDGAILAQNETAVEQGESLDSLIRRTKRIGARLMVETVQALRDGTFTERENPREQASYFTFPTRDDVREFRRRGYRLV